MWLEKKIIYCANMTKTGHDAKCQTKQLKNTTGGFWGQRCAFHRYEATVYAVLLEITSLPLANLFIMWLVCEVIGLRRSPGEGGPAQARETSALFLLL